MQENRLYALWQSLARSGQWVNDGHHRLRVLRSGTLNLSYGPDFTGAYFELDDVRYFGDVEMHIRQNDWYRHGHHLDPFYKNVALHVVFMAPQSQHEVHSQVSHRSIPSFSLNSDLLPGNFVHPALRCKPPRSLDKQAIIQSFKALALRRLEGKMRFYLQELQVKPKDQVFYESFLKILGYPKNTFPFQLLARRLPFSWLERTWHTPWIGFDILYALYSGQAGFFNHSTSDAYMKRLQFYYHQFQNTLPSSALPEVQWQMSGLRPVNHPHFRLAGWAALITGHQQFPAQTLYALFSERRPYPLLYKNILHYFQLPISGYWSNHSRLGGRPLTKRFRYYFGPARIVEIILNLLIPFFCVQAQQSASQGFLAYLKNFYFWLPHITSYQSVYKYFYWWKYYLALWPHQVLWQSLIQLNLEYCRVEACAQCPLGRRHVDKEAEID